MQVKRLSKFLCVIVFAFCGLLFCQLFEQKQTNYDVYANEVEYTEVADLSIKDEAVCGDYLVTSLSGYYVFSLFDVSLDGAYNLTGNLFDETKTYTINYDECFSNCSTLVENGVGTNQLLMMNKNASISNPCVVIAINEYAELNGDILHTYFIKYNVILNDADCVVFFVGYTDTDNNYQQLSKVVPMNNNTLATSQFLSGNITSYNFEVLDPTSDDGDAFLCLIDNQNSETEISSSVNLKKIVIDISSHVNSLASPEPMRLPSDNPLATVGEIYKINILKQSASNVIINRATFYMSVGIDDENICAIEPKAFYMQEVNNLFLLPMRIVYDSDFININTLKQIWRVYPTAEYQRSQLETYPIALEQKGNSNINLDLNNLLTTVYTNQTELPSLKYTVSLCLYDVYSNMVGYADIELPISQNKTSAQYVIDCINEIGEVVYKQDCLNKIEYVEREYLALTELEKTQVTNYFQLSSARKKYNNLAIADECISLIESIGEVNYNTESLLKITSAETFFDGLTSEQKALVDNHTDLINARSIYDNIKQTRETAIENSLDSITLNCADTVILYLDEEAESNSFLISANGVFSASGLVCEWYVTSNTIFEYEISENNIYIMPFNSGECNLIALYKFESGKTLCKSIVIKVLENAPTALIKIKKEGNDAFNIYDELTISASYDCDYSFGAEAYCKWFIDDVLISDIKAFAFNKSLAFGSHKIVVNIYEYDDGQPKVATTEIYVYDVKDVEKTLTLSYEGEIYAYLDGGEFDVYAYIDLFKDNSYTYAWSIGDASIINYAYEHLNRNYVILKPVSAGVTKLYVMVDVGVHDSKILVCELIINVFDTIDSFGIDGITNYCKPNTITDFKLLVNGGNEIVNIAPSWEVYRNNEKLDITNNSNLLNFNFDSAGNYIVKVSYADESASVELNCASVDIKTVLISLVPFCVLIAFVSMLIWAIIKRRKDNLLLLKEDFEKLEKKVTKFIANITDSNKTVEKLQNKCNHYGLGLSIRLKELRIKTENISLENMIEVESIYKKIDDAILTIEAYRNNIKYYKSKQKLSKVYEVLLNSNIQVCSKLLQEKLEIKQKYLQQIKGNINSVGVKVFEKTNNKKHKTSQKEYEEYLKQKRCYYADDADDGDD